MNLLLIDFEATDKIPTTARITEIGAMVTDMDFNEPLAEMSQLVWESGYPAITPEVEAITHISQAMLDEKGLPFSEAARELGELALMDIKYVIAYNRGYDEVLFKHEAVRNLASMIPGINHMAQLPWICAMEDVETHYKFQARRLMHVALEYGVTVDPKKLHRAIADVELMREMLKATGLHPEGMYAFQQEPWMYVVADTKGPWLDGGKSTQIAKDKGFSFEKAKGDFSGKSFSKAWVKRIKPRHFKELEHQCNFTIKEIK